MSITHRRLPGRGSPSTQIDWKGPASPHTVVGSDPNLAMAADAAISGGKLQANGAAASGASQSGPADLQSCVTSKIVEFSGGTNLSAFVVCTRESFSPTSRGRPPPFHPAYQGRARRQCWPERAAWFRAFWPKSRCKSSNTKQMRDVHLRKVTRLIPPPRLTAPPRSCPSRRRRTPSRSRSCSARG